MRRLSRMKKACLWIAAAAVIAFPVRQAVAIPLKAVSAVVEPEIPQGARLLAYRLASTYEAGDILAYHDGEVYRLARVVEPGEDALVVSRNGQPDFVIPRSQVIGRVVVNTR